MSILSDLTKDNLGDAFKNVCLSCFLLYFNELCKPIQGNFANF